MIVRKSGLGGRFCSSIFVNFERISSHLTWVVLYRYVDIFKVLVGMIDPSDRLKVMALWSLEGQIDKSTCQLETESRLGVLTKVRSIIDFLTRPCVTVSKVGVSPTLHIDRLWSVIKSYTTLPRLLSCSDPQEVCHPLKSPHTMYGDPEICRRKFASFPSVLLSSVLGVTYTDTRYILNPDLFRICTVHIFGSEYAKIPKELNVFSLMRIADLVKAEDPNWCVVYPGMGLKVF